MANFKLYNIARMTTATTGTGTITLGAAVPSFLSFAGAGVSDGEIVTYAIEDGSNREIGRGTYTAAGTTLARTTILNSTNGGSAISLSGGAQVFITAAAQDFPWAINTSTNALTASSTATSASPTTGAVVITGGLGVGDNIWVLNKLNIGSTSVLSNDPGFLLQSDFPQQWQILCSQANGQIYWYDATNAKFPFALNPGAPTNTFVISAAGGVSVGAATDPGAGGLFINANMWHPTVASSLIATVLGSLGPTGSHTTVQEWFPIKNASGTIRYVPGF